MHCLQKKQLIHQKVAPYRTYFRAQLQLTLTSNPYISMHILHTVLYTFYIYLVIISYIPVTSMCDSPVVV